MHMLISRRDYMEFQLSNKFQVNEKISFLVCENNGRSRTIRTNLAFWLAHVGIPGEEELF